MRPCPGARCVTSSAAVAEHHAAVAWPSLIFHLSAFAPSRTSAGHRLFTASPGGPYCAKSRALHRRRRTCAPSEPRRSCPFMVIPPAVATRTRHRVVLASTVVPDGYSHHGPSACHPQWPALAAQQAVGTNGRQLISVSYRLAHGCAPHLPGPATQHLRPFLGTSTARRQHSRHRRRRFASLGNRQHLASR